MKTEIKLWYFDFNYYFGKLHTEFPDIIKHESKPSETMLCRK